MDGIISDERCGPVDSHYLNNYQAFPKQNNSIGFQVGEANMGEKVEDTNKQLESLLTLTFFFYEERVQFNNSMNKINCSSLVTKNMRMIFNISFIERNYFQINKS